MSAEVQRLGYPEFTTEGLEKAFQNLKAAGLVAIKAEGADVVAEADPEGSEQTVQAGAGATQQRSSKRGSTVSTRSGARTAASVTTQPSLDDAYTMPMDKLLELANKQLAETNRGE